MGKEKLKIAIVATEASPYVKSGGLGDVIGSLPNELQKAGADARVFIPKFRKIKKEFIDSMELVTSWTMKHGWHEHQIELYKLKNEEVYFIGNDYFFGRDGLYGYGDDAERFALFSKAAIEAVGQIDFQADIMHFNDWQAGIGCLFLNEIYKKYVFYSNMKSVYTIHNLQYQGSFSFDAMDTIGLPPEFKWNNKIEYYGRINYMKAGITNADIVTTVSPTYAEEIKTHEFGYGMDGLLSSRSNDLYGILNGIDTVTNNPLTDDRIFVNFDVNTIDKKYKNKRALQEKLKLPIKSDVPVISMITRFATQKGIDILGVCLEELLSMDVQIVVLGTGEHQYEQLFRDAAFRRPDKISSNIFFDEELAQEIYAGSDMFLMPSLFEPCGLGQLIAMRYGTVPIARRVGGLNDTVKHFNYDDNTGNGFVFEDYLASGLMWGIREAVHLYAEHPERWKIAVKNAITSDFSWDKSAKQYMEMYKEMLL